MYARLMLKYPSELLELRLIIGAFSASTDRGCTAAGTSPGGAGTRTAAWLSRSGSPELRDFGTRLLQFCPHG